MWIRTEAAQFAEKECINGIFLAVPWRYAILFAIVLSVKTCISVLIFVLLAFRKHFNGFESSVKICVFLNSNTHKNSDYIMHFCKHSSQTRTNSLMLLLSTGLDRQGIVKIIEHYYNVATESIEWFVKNQALVWFGSSPTPSSSPINNKLSLFLCLLVGCRSSWLRADAERKEGEWEVGGAKSYKGEKAWSSIDHSTLSVSKAYAFGNIVLFTYLLFPCMTLSAVLYFFV
jgi:hypothetical protein